MKYLSLFSGIGGFEVAIHRIFPDAECIGYSEIEKNALAVYKHHFPKHKNLGDITKLTEQELLRVIADGCDLVVGGFPCKNLSSVARLNRYGDSSGLKGKQSGLFYDMIRIMKIVFRENKDVNFVIENNASMKISSRETITKCLEEIWKYGNRIYITKLDCASFGVQTRKRLFWTNFPISIRDIKCEQTWDDVLEPVCEVKNWKLSGKYIKYFNKIYPSKKRRRTKVCVVEGKFYKFDFLPEENQTSRWDMGFISDMMNTQLYSPYPIGKSRTILSKTGGNNMVIDRRFGKKDSFIPRELTSVEKERLFGYVDGYTGILGSKTARTKVLGNTVAIFVVEHVIQYLLLSLLKD